jgi:hypothetical protein
MREHFARGLRAATGALMVAVGSGSCIKSKAPQDARELESCPPGYVERELMDRAYAGCFRPCDTTDDCRAGEMCNSRIMKNPEGFMHHSPVEVCLTLDSKNARGDFRLRWPRTGTAAPRTP